MSATLTPDAENCTFTLDGWDMAMSAPTGGSVDGDAVTLTGDGWSDCTGTIAADGASASGTCAGDGCGWTLTQD